MEVRGNRSPVPSVSSKAYFSEYLKNGASREMSVDGSTPANFDITVPAGEVWLFYRSFIFLEHGAVALDPAKFGTLTALGNGVQFGILPVGGSFLEYENWTTNHEVVMTCYDHQNGLKGAGTLFLRWTQERDVGNPILLNAGDKVRGIVRDNIAAVDSLEIKCKFRKVIY